MIWRKTIGAGGAAAPLGFLLTNTITTYDIATLTNIDNITSGDLTTAGSTDGSVGEVVYDPTNKVLFGTTGSDLIDDPQLYSVDVSDPTSLVVNDVYTIGNYVSGSIGVTPDGSTLFGGATVGTDTLYSFDVSTSTSLSQISTLTGITFITDPFVCRVSPSGDRLFVASTPTGSSSQGFRGFNVSNTSSMSYLGLFQPGLTETGVLATNASYECPTNIAMTTDNVYAAVVLQDDDLDEVFLMTCDPEDLSVVDWIQLTGLSGGLDTDLPASMGTFNVSGSEYLALLSDKGMVILSISSLGVLSVVYSDNTLFGVNTVSSMVIDRDNFVFYVTAANDSTLYSVDASNPSSLSATLLTSGYTSGGLVAFLPPI